MYLPTIGLEIHAELKTRTKMFCESANDPNELRPNVNVCPVCLAYPGTLPVINLEAVRHVLRIGVAIGGTLADDTEFDRKNYFYPDIPKGYQISQYEHPLVSGGELSGVAVTRVHLEEDTARSSHVGGQSVVDFNRAGIPLMELVTEPVIHDSATAGAFARELQLLLRTLGAGHANLEKGEMRIEANISVHKEEGEGKGSLGTKVEVKNLNSFRSAERAIDFEIQRQIALIESGGHVMQETRGWNESKQETFHQRFKEGSADYRYFPEPDLPKLTISSRQDLSLESLRASLPELPWERRARYVRDYGLKDSDVAYLCGDIERSAFYDAVANALNNENPLLSLAANYIISDLAGIQSKNEEGTLPAVDPDSIAKLVRLVSGQKLSSRGAKDVLEILVRTGGDPEAIAIENNLMQMHDTEALRSAVRGVICQETKAVEEYLAGKLASLQYLIGMGMKATKGAGNPAILAQLFKEELDKSPETSID